MAQQQQRPGNSAPRGGLGGPGGGRGGFGGPGGGMGVADKPQNFGRSIKQLLGYMRAYRPALIFVVLFAVCSTVFNIVGPRILAQATDTLVSGVTAMMSGTGGIDFVSIGQILLFLIVIYLISAGFAYMQGFLMSGVSNKVTYRLRRDISGKIHRLPLKYFEGSSQGDILSRVTNDVDTISQSLTQSIVQIITSVTTLIGVIIMMFSISAMMTGITLLVVPLSMVFTLSIVKRSQKYFVDQQNYLGEVNGHIEETYSGQAIVRAFNNEAQRFSTFQNLNGRLYQTVWKSQFLSGLIMPAVTFIGNLGYVAVCIAGAALAGGGAVTLGGIQAFLQYVRTFNQPLAQVANISNILQQTAAAAERVFIFLGEEEEVPEAQRPIRMETTQDGIFLHWQDADGTVQKQPFCGNVEFINVSFGYDPEKIIIHNFSLFVDAGKKVAIVGPTGAGKTTIVKLLMRFYDVQSGQILLDGHDIRNFARGDLRRLFGMVLQETWLYHDTIGENIRYGRRDASNEEVIAAATAARADSFVRTMPGGYKVEIDEESSNISAGQKQLLTIARAILADPPMLILDEATSSVDTKTEVDIQKAMDTLMERRTSFVIAHRLSTIRDCDTILMMKDGDIVETGNHQQLMERGGAYAELYNAQFEQE